MVPYVSLRFLYVEVMWPFPIFPRTGPVAFLYMFICHLPTKSSGGVANAFLQSSDVEEVVWVSHMKSASGQNDILQNVGGGDDEWRGQASKKRIFYVFHKQKCSCVGNPTLCWYESAEQRSGSNWLPLGVGGNHTAIWVKKSRQKKRRTSGLFRNDIP